ncbi:MAG TPA: hypothetical protein PK668_19180 [Myxococcota bacterium]|nr:hypothetical protein [Myxococcota bacterium]HRY95145.1 hypothetical protein [Myxococcota bacterium]HSA24087.1 hypothetical protein [Myxococcota bacterium]
MNAATRLARCRLVAGLALLTLGCAGAPGPGPRPPPAELPAAEGRQLVLAYQANVQGELEPCG